MLRGGGSAAHGASRSPPGHQQWALEGRASTNSAQPDKEGVIFSKLQLARKDFTTGEETLGTAGPGPIGKPWPWPASFAARQR